jgi:hypothetical protein
MKCSEDTCFSKYSLDRLVRYAKKRFIEGIQTVDLLKTANSEIEKEEIMLIAFLDVEDKEIHDLLLGCTEDDSRLLLNCREILKSLIENELQQPAPG